MTSELSIERVLLSDLHEDENNSRLHGEKNIEAIKRSLEQFGQVEPLVVQKKTNRVIGGNGRLRVMKELGWKKANVVVLDLSDSKATALGIGLNRTSELAEWNEATLVKTLDEISAEFPHEVLGFEIKDLDFGKMLNPIGSKEVSFMALEETLKNECPRCKFRF